MKRLIAISIFLLLSSAVFAEGSDEDSTPLEPETNQAPESVKVYKPTRKDDKYIKMGLTLNIPLFNTSSTKFAIPSKIYPGGGFYFGFGYFVTNALSLGGSVSFDFYITLATNLYFSVPFTFDMLYTFSYSKWRFPVGIGIGGNFQTYNETKYFSPIFRPEVGFHYQYSPEWSFGATFGWSIVPQWYKRKEYTRTGNILLASFAARYHF